MASRDSVGFFSYPQHHFERSGPIPELPGLYWRREQRCYQSLQIVPQAVVGRALAAREARP